MTSARNTGLLLRLSAMGTALLVGAVGGVALDVSAPPAHAAPAVTVVPIGIDGGGPKTERYGRGVDARPAGDRYWLTVDPAWIEVGYTVVGGSGGGVAHYQGGRGARIDGELRAAGGSVLLVRPGKDGGPGQTGGESSSGYSGAWGGVGQGVRTNTQLTPHRRFDNGAGGGQASYLAYVDRSDSVDGRVDFVVAGAGGGAAGGDGYAETPFGSPVCRGAAGGDAGAAGGSAAEYVSPASGDFGDFVVCRAAAGGRSGADLAQGSSTVDGDGSGADWAPGGGGGGGGVHMGEGGRAVAGDPGAELFPPGGGAGGGGGGSSRVPAGDSYVLADTRGDGYIDISWYVPHATGLAVAPAAGRAVSGTPIAFHLVFQVPLNGFAEAAAGATITATLDGAPVRVPGTATPVVGTLAEGIELVLPPSGDEPHDVCFTLQPGSARLLPPTPACLQLEVERAELTPALSTPDVLATVAHPDCPGGTCVEVPVTAYGTLLQPVLLPEAGVDIATLATESLALTIEWRDLTSTASGSWSRTVARATDILGAAMPVRPDGGVPFAYLSWIPGLEAGHVYEARVSVADTSMFAFAESAPIYIRAVHRETTLDLTVPATVSTSGEIVVDGSITATEGPRLPSCCSTLTIAPGFPRPAGTFAATLESVDAPGVVLSSVDLPGDPGGLSTTSGSLPAPDAAGDYRVTLHYRSSDWRFADHAVSRTVTVERTATQTTIAVTPPSGSRYGAPWRLETTIAVVAPGHGAPTGTVGFEIDMAGRGTVWSGVATVDPASGAAAIDLDTGTRQLLPGEAVITARYSGDDGRAASTSTLALRISAAGTVATLSASDEIPYGDPLPWSAIVASGPVPGGSLLPPPAASLDWTVGDATATLLQGTTAPSSTSVVQSSADYEDVVDTRALEPGEYVFGVGFTGDGSYADATAAQTFAVVARATTLAVATDRPTIGYREVGPIRIAADAGGVVVEGDVRVIAHGAAGAVEIGTVSLSGGAAAIVPDAAVAELLAPGGFRIEACLAASARFAASCAETELAVRPASLLVVVPAVAPPHYGGPFSIDVVVTWDADAVPASASPDAPGIAIGEAFRTASPQLVERSAGAARYRVGIPAGAGPEPGGFVVRASTSATDAFEAARGSGRLEVLRAPVAVHAEAEDGLVRVRVTSVSPGAGVPAGEVALRGEGLSAGPVSLDAGGSAELGLTDGARAGSGATVTIRYAGSTRHAPGSAELLVGSLPTEGVLVPQPEGTPVPQPEGIPVPQSVDGDGSSVPLPEVAPSAPWAVIVAGLAAVGGILLLILLLRRRRRSADG